jgi:hypothetical protein
MNYLKDGCGKQIPEGHVHVQADDEDTTTDELKSFCDGCYRSPVEKIEFGRAVVRRGILRRLLKGNESGGQFGINLRRRNKDEQQQLRRAGHSQARRNLG